MPALIRGDMFSVMGLHPNSLFLVTANSTVRRDGHLVMGCGAAQRLAELMPKFPAAAGAMVVSVYGVLIFRDLLGSSKHLGLFQVKRHFAENADPELIRLSVSRLQKLLAAHQLEPAPIERVDLNYPGIGFGGLGAKEVWPLLASLPDYVYVWSFPGQDV